MNKAPDNKIIQNNRRADTGIHIIEDEVQIHDSISSIWCSKNKTQINWIDFC
jgi:hypothetical protein